MIPLTLGNWVKTAGLDAPFEKAWGQLSVPSDAGLQSAKRLNIDYRNVRAWETEIERDRKSEALKAQEIVCDRESALQLWFKEKHTETVVSQ